MSFYVCFSGEEKTKLCEEKSLILSHSVGLMSGI